MVRLHDRYSSDSLVTGSTAIDGRLFSSDSFGINDLSRVNLLMSSVDTVRQLYTGSIKFDLAQLDGLRILSAFDLPCKDHYSSSSPLGLDWAISRLGKTSGYRYLLQNKREGIIVLIGSYYAPLDCPGAHLKVELSPGLLSGLSPADVQKRILDRLADFFLSDWKASGVALHLALDIQGWLPPDDFLGRFVTRARTIKNHQGIGSAEFDLSDVAVSYSVGQSYLIGRAASLQVAVYRKDLEILASDKIDYFHRVWPKNFDKDKPVWRVEFRFHHSVIREVGEGLGEPLDTYEQSARYLSDLWLYGMQKNRLMSTQRLVNAYWQLFMQDAEFISPKTGIYIQRQKKQSIASIGRNLAGALGNMVTLWARSRLTIKEVRKQIRNFSFFKDLIGYYESRGMSEYDFFAYVEKQLILRRLTHSKAA